MNNFTLTVNRKSIASIDGFRCVNCGECEDSCPVDAIGERQKIVCHLCPACTEKPGLPRKKLDEMQEESCNLACPQGISPQGYIGLIKAGKEKEAYQIILKKTPLPSVCGYVCTRPCEEVCKRGTLVDSPVEIRGLKRYLGEKFADEPLDPYPVLYQEEIAVIGAGPAGLAAAHALAQRGYPVTVFDQAAEAGGMLIRGIPDFRIDKALVRKEIKRLEEAGIRFVLGAKVRPEELKKDYDKVILATGVPVPNHVEAENWRSKNIYLALNFMEKVNAGDEVPLSGKVIVIGGGSVAVDCARTATRLGAEKVTMMALESGEVLPAPARDIQEARDEGVELIEGASAVRYEEYHDALPHKLVGVTYTKIEDLDPEKYTFKRVGEEMTIPADYVIVATGSKAEAQYAEGADLLCGDVAEGKSTNVVDAMASGRRAAIQLDAELRGREVKDYQTDRKIEAGEPQYRVYPAVRRKANFPGMPVREDRSTFDLVEEGFDEEGAKLETYRCLECGYRKVDPERCIGCGVCREVCPKGDVITMVPVEAEKLEEVAK